MDARDKHGGPSSSPPRSLLLSVIPMSGEFVITLDLAGPDYCVSDGKFVAPLDITVSNIGALSRRAEITYMHRISKFASNAGKLPSAGRILP